MPNVQQMERDVLATFVRLSEADPEGAWAAYYPAIFEAAEGSVDFAEQVCRKLRQRKLLTGDGRGLHATYWPTEKGVVRARKDASS